MELNRDFVLKLAKIRKSKFKSVLAFHQATGLSVPSSTFKNYLNRSFPNFRDLHVFLKICSILDISLKELEKNILAYRFKRSRITIHQPFLPISVTPIFPMLIAHMIGDGNIVRFKNKKTVYFSYRQYTPKLRLLLVEKMNALLGKVTYKREYFMDGTRVYLPEVATKILCDYYSLSDSSFLSLSATLPEKIMASPKEHLLAVLLAFLIDEGHVDSAQLVIRLKNEKLVGQLAKICDKLGYENSVTPIDKHGMIALYILKRGLEKIWPDYLELKQKFPEVDIGYREEKIKSNIERFKKDWKSRGHNQTRNTVIAALKEEPATVWGLAQKLDISRQGIRYQIRQLFEMGVLSRIKVKESAFLYSLKKEIIFEETLKGQSRPIGETMSRIKELLSTPKTTLEIIKTVAIEKSMVRKTLSKLHQNGEIIMLGRKHTGAMPTKIWQVLN